MKKSSSFAGDAAIYTISNFSVAGIPFLLMPVLTRVLTPEAYGLVAMFTVVVSLLVVCIGLNVHGAIMVRFFERGALHLPSYVTTCLIILAVSMTVFCVVIVVFAEVLVKATAIPVLWLFVAVLVAACQSVVQIMLILLQASKKPKQYGALRIGQAVTDGIISLVLVVVLSYSWQGRLSGMALAWMIAGSVAICLMRSQGWVSRTPNAACANDALRYGLPLIPHALGALFLGMADRFLVTNLLNIESTGVYVVAIQIGMVLGITADAINRAFAPWLMETLLQASYEKKCSIVKYTYLYFSVMLLVATVGALLTPYLLDMLVGPRYQAAAPIVGYILFGNAFMGMYYMVTNYVFIVRRTELLSSLTLAVGVTNTAVTYYLIIEGGIVGAAQAFMIGQALLFLGTWLIANYCYQMPWMRAIKKCRQ